MKESIYFSVSKDIAERCGVVDTTYKTKDGRSIVTSREMQRLMLTPDEYVNGVDAIRMTKKEAEKAIKDGGYNLGSKEKEETKEEEMSNE